MSFSDVIVTDYGVVKISAKSLKWLCCLDEDWRNIAWNKRRRGKKARLVREKFAQFESAVCIAAAIAWANDDDLTEF